MSARKFLSELDRRKFLSDRVMTKLRESLAATRSPLSAEKLANFLVQKKHLTQQQANDVLAGLTQSGVNLIEEDPEPDDEGEGSSIFAPSIVGRRPSPTPDPEEEDEIRLAPIEEESPAPARSKRGSVTDDAPVLGAIPQIGPSQTQKPVAESPVVRIADTFETDDSEALAVEKRRTSVGVTPARRTSKLGGGGKTRATKKAKSTKDKKRWDSPIILMGGGALVFLVLAGGLIAFLLTQDSGEQMLLTARTARDSGNFPQAVKLYKEFLTAAPRHPQNSAARVELAMMQIRQPTEAGDFAAALAAAETESKSVEDEPAFKDSQADLAALIPQIAQGLAMQAEKSPPTSDDSKKFIGLANKALELSNNANYVPKSLRDEAKLTAIRDALQRVERRQESQNALAAGLKAMGEAIGAGKPIESYAIHTKLIREHPELAEEKSLTEAIRNTTAAELAAIKFVDEQQPAETKELPTPWIAALAVSSHRGGTAPATGTACVRVDGAVYALDVASGRLLWRRYVGFGSTSFPIVVGQQVLVCDAVRRELMRLDAATGKLDWRQSFKEPFGEPLVFGDRAFVPADSGRLYVVDLNSGTRIGYLQVAQPLRVMPAVGRSQKHVYIVGDQASLYTISLADMKCLGVYFLGHAPGTIQVAPSAVMDKLVVSENNGAETSRLRLLGIDDKGAITRQLADRRLTGLVTTPPLATGRGFIVLSDRGQIEAYDVAAGADGEPLILVATRDAVTAAQPLTRHAAVIGRNVWVADNQLTKYNIVPTGNRLPVEEIQNNFAGATFDHPLAVFGDTLIEIHRPKGRAGAVVATIDTKLGRVLWETDLAMAPAGTPVIDETAKSLTFATAAGYAFRFDEAAIRSRVQDQPLVDSLAPPRLPLLTTSTDLGQGRAVFSAENSDWLLLCSPAQSGAAKWIHLESPLACDPTLFGAGFLAPLKIGQVFYLSSINGERLAVPFQPRVEPGTSVDYKSAGVAAGNANQFVITDGATKVYLVGLAQSPVPHLEALKEADVGAQAISSPVVVLGETSLAVAGDSRLVRFRLPSLEAIGVTNLPAPAEWGPFVAGDVALLATVDQKLIAATVAGELKWQVPLEHGQLAGKPLVTPDSVILAYRKGIVERRALADGKPAGALNIEQPLATGPVAFLQKLVVTAADGTLLVIDQPK